MAEMGKRSSRTLLHNLCTRVFNVFDKQWRDPIKGNKVPIYSVKRKVYPTELCMPAKKFRVVDKIEKVKKQSSIMA